MSPELAKLHCNVINHAANGGTVKRIPKSIVKDPNVSLRLDMWDIVLPHEDFNFEHYVYDFIDENPYTNMFAQKEEAKLPTKTLPFIAGKMAEEQCALIKHFADGGTVKRMPVKLRHTPGVEWEVMGLDDNFNFDYFEYKVVKEEKTEKTEKVQLLAWFTGTTMVYRTYEATHECREIGYRRIPDEDKLVEVQNGH